jgi:uncharacterized protein (DUF2345 family)
MQSPAGQKTEEVRQQATVIVAVPAGIALTAPVALRWDSEDACHNREQRSWLRADGKVVASKTFWQALHTTALIAAACL